MLCCLNDPCWLHAVTFTVSPSLFMYCFSVWGHRWKEEIRELWGANKRPTVQQHKSLPHYGLQPRRVLWQSCQGCEFNYITGYGPQDPKTVDTLKREVVCLNSFWYLIFFTFSCFLFCLSNDLLIPCCVTPIFSKDQNAWSSERTWPRSEELVSVLFHSRRNTCVVLEMPDRSLF